MIQINLLLTIVIAGTSCATGQNTMTKEITVTVIDKKDGKPIDNAKVTLKTWTDSNLNNETKQTDPEGKCNFSFDFKVSTNYQIFTRKKGYFVYFNKEENDKLESNTDITNKTGSEINLYLTSDSLHLVAYYEKRTPHYQIDTLIQLLKTDNYEPRGVYSLPKLNWENIPKLLEIGNDQTIITNFPRNGISSYFQKNCYLGIISLWLLESIRISEQRGLINPIDKFPSPNPMLIDKENQTRTPASNNVQIMETAHQAYKHWWLIIKNIDKEEACKTDPLKETNLRW